LDWGQKLHPAVCALKTKLNNELGIKEGINVTPAL